MRVKFIATIEIPLRNDPQAQQYWAALLQEAFNRWRKVYAEKHETAIEDITIEPYKPDEQGIGQVDVSNPELVEVRIAYDGKKVWVNVNGHCAFRGSQIQRLQVNDEFKRRGYERSDKPFEHIEEIDPGVEGKVDPLVPRRSN